MEPQRNTNATLVDLLDRVLDKGLIIHADLIVSVAGIPLIGVNLRAALAGMETMLKYGMMKGWDESIRANERNLNSKQQNAVIQGEEIILKTTGACYANRGIFRTWRYGHLYLTSSRLLIYHEGFKEILFETPLEKIQGIVARMEDGPTDNKEKALCLILKDCIVARLKTAKNAQLKSAIENRMKELGLSLRDSTDEWDTILTQIIAQQNSRVDPLSVISG